MAGTPTVQEVTGVPQQGEEDGMRILSRPSGSRRSGFQLSGGCENPGRNRSPGSSRPALALTATPLRKPGIDVTLPRLTAVALTTIHPGILA